MAQQTVHFGACLVAACLIAAGPAAAAGQTVLWRASSTTAMGITGDIRIGPDQIQIGKRRFKLAFVRDLTEAEDAETGDILSDRTARGRLYDVQIPAIKFRHGNVLCRGATTRLVLVDDGSARPAMLRLIAFEGDREIYFPGWKDTTDHLCGTFTYDRG